jgi:glutamate-ammonia-ligase adenylyltransferase
VQYYERWAKTWEFQALLKARHVAGDAALGSRYIEAVTDKVWSAANRPDFVEDVQAMRRRVEEHVPPSEAPRQIKLGPGGLRDVEFSVQLLQLVHGRSDASLRSGTTLAALAALSAGGYVARDDAAALEGAYRRLRTLEHRIQLMRLRRTHLMPTAEADLRRLGRALGHTGDPADAVTRQWQEDRREVRRIHERLFYRPLLSAVARLSRDEARLAPEAARDRLAALGFRDPRGALKHLEALTAGVSRRAAIQRTLLPVMLGWFADESDPDAGLLAFRKVSDELGSSHWYLKMLRDEGGAAERLAHVLGRSRFVGELLVGAPEAVQFLGEGGGLRPRSRQELVRRMTAAAGRREGSADKAAAIRAVRRAELFRVAVADLDGFIQDEGVPAALTDLSVAVIATTLEVAVAEVEERQGPLGTDLLVVGMGRLGGNECGYASDADVLFVHDPREGVAEDVAQQQAVEVVQTLLRLLDQKGPDLPVVIDASLRPEGKNGPIIRSLAAHRAYYARWSLVWEAQALLRAAPVAGDEDLGRRFLELVDPIRWPAGGIGGRGVREVRLLKARMESERLPRGADRRTHLKLGPGGLSDVEWTVQLLQLEHAHAVEGLRTTSTLGALRAALDAGLLTDEDAASLRNAWELASRIRDAATLHRGKAVDVLPRETQDANGVARILGMPPASGQLLAEQWLRVARRARAATDHVFYGHTGSGHPLG